VIPLFHEQIYNGGPVTITTTDMTRFLLSLDQAVDTIFNALRYANRGETYIPRVPACKVVDIAAALIGSRPIKTIVTGIRPGEKVHEILVSEEEGNRTVTRGNYHVILPILPELLQKKMEDQPLGHEFCSADSVMSFSEVKALLENNDLMLPDRPDSQSELLR
jgi:UDP-glucose 4-epimerase